MLNPDYVLTEHDRSLIAAGVCDEEYIRVARMTPKQLREQSTVTVVCFRHCLENCSKCEPTTEGGR